MGTRADFYVGRGADAEWLGSVAMDGYPSGIKPDVLWAKSEQEYRENVTAFLAETDHASLPEHGWPWPWNTSSTTDYAYAFDGDDVFASCFGGDWFDPEQPEPESDGGKNATFPDMAEKKRVTFGRRSGLIFLTSKPEVAS